MKAIRHLGMTLQLSLALFVAACLGGQLFAACSSGLVPESDSRQLCVAALQSSGSLAKIASELDVTEQEFASTVCIIGSDVVRLIERAEARRRAKAAAGAAIVPSAVAAAGSP